MYWILVFVIIGLVLALMSSKATPTVATQRVNKGKREYMRSTSDSHIEYNKHISVTMFAFTSGCSVSDAEAAYIRSYIKNAIKEGVKNSPDMEKKLDASCGKLLYTMAEQGKEFGINPNSTQAAVARDWLLDFWVRVQEQPFSSYAG